MPAGVHVMMRVGFDDGIDPQRHLRLHLALACQPIEHFQFLHRLDVDPAQAILQREDHSLSVLPTPANTIEDGSAPARSARYASPADTTSKPEPSSRSTRRSAPLALDFTEK